MMCYNAKMYFPAEEEAAVTDEVTGTNNIVLISYSVLNQNKEYHSAPPTCCRGCSAALCTYSVLHSRENYFQKKTEEEASKKPEENGEQEKKVKETNSLKGKYIQDLSEDEVAWICEFCGVHNRLSKDIRAPGSEDELYVLKKNIVQEKPKEEQKTETADHQQEVNFADDTSLIFCIDVSGSMGEKHQVTNDGQTQSVSRINLITQAVLKQIEEMKITHPNRKIGLVAFDDKITLYGDCTGTIVPVNVSLNDFDKLLGFSKEHKQSTMNKPLKDSFDQVSAAVKKLGPGGWTALGPGLLCALGLVQEKPGSRIILCTDGLANRGLGVLEGSTVSRESQQFYDKVGDVAVDSGVSVSIITIQGNACRVDALGPLTDRTAGTILRVDPANMDLTELAANSLIATNVKLKAIMHEGLAFHNENPIHLTHNGSVLVKNVGSVSENNEAYYEYRVKSTETLKEAGVDLEAVKFLPLQSQITYIDLKGNEFIRVISKQQEITKEKQEAEKEVQASVLTGYLAKETANLALQGKTTEAKKKNAGWMGFMNKVANNAPMSEANQKAYDDFQFENQELHDLIAQTEAAPRNIAEQDDIASKLYSKKQMKKK